MEILIVVGTLLVCFALGVPIAYALGLGALAGAYRIGIPLEAVMLQVSSGVSKFAMLTIPFFVLAGAIMAEGGMARRLVALANAIVGFARIRGGIVKTADGSISRQLIDADNTPALWMAFDSRQ